MKVIALLFVFLISYSFGQSTICERYASALGLNHTTLVSTAVNLAVGKILTPSNGLLKYFDGTSGTVSTNYVTNTTAFGQLAGHLVTYFGQALGCSDGTIPPYTGRSMSEAHATMGVNYREYNKFNYLVLETLSELGFMDNDTEAVATALHQPGAICKAADCQNICNKYSIPYNLNNSALVGSVVINVVSAALGNSLLLPFFDGTTPSGSTNYTDPANNAKFSTLATNLINFFGVALGCSDSSIPPYTGKTMKAAHSAMPINNAVFNTFNGAVISVMTGLGVTKADTDAVLGVLESTRADICNQADCFNSTSGAVSSAGGSSAGGSSAGGSSAGGSSAAVSSKSSSSSSSSSTGSGYVLFVSTLLLFIALF